jgi:Flp pilus assembly protein TadG
MVRASRRFGRDRRGNMAVIFTLACLPLVPAIGCAVDYSRLTQLRGKLQAAADAASVGSVTKGAPALIAAATMTSDGGIAIGAADAANIFYGNMSDVTGFALDGMTAMVTKSGAKVTAEVTFKASVPTVFLRVFGKRAITVTGGSTATANLPRYIDVYFPPRQFAANGSRLDPGRPSQSHAQSMRPR